MGTLARDDEILTPIEVFKRGLLHGMGKNNVYEFIRTQVPHTTLGNKMYVHTGALRLATMVPGFKAMVDQAAARLNEDPTKLIRLLAQNPAELLREVLKEEAAEKAD